MVSLLTLAGQFADTACTKQFLGLLPWNNYLDYDSNCNLIHFHVLGANSSLLLIGLAIIDDLFRLAGLLAVAFVIYSGFQFVLSQGSPEEAAKARTTGINALVGLGISLIAITFVSFLGAQLGGGGRGAADGPFGLNVNSLPNPVGVENGNIFQGALSIVFGVLGAIAFLIIVIAGMQYAFSQGDPQATGKAKAAIIYALIGLIIAILAQSIVSFAVNHQP